MSASAEADESHEQPLLADERGERHLSPLLLSTDPDSERAAARKVRRWRRQRRRLAALGAAVLGIVGVLALVRQAEPSAPQLEMAPPSRENLRIYIYDLPPALDSDVRLAPFDGEWEWWLRSSEEYNADVVRHCARVCR